MSDTESPDETRDPARDKPQRALDEVTRLVRHLGDELAGYRKRALSAEARLKLLDEQAALGGIPPARALALEQENVELRRRLDAARDRTHALLARVRFLRQQNGSVA